MQLVQVRDGDGSLPVGLVKDGDVFDLTSAEPILGGSRLGLLKAGVE